jgi:Kef-type K+ transport system membrane component KefB
MVSILLLEDLAIVPLLALVAFLAPRAAEEVTVDDRMLSVAVGLGAIALLILAGRYLLNPMFRVLATFGGREVMTRGALLVVLGSALLLDAGGLSAAMGAFLAGVLLSESHLPPSARGRCGAVPRASPWPVLPAVGMSLDLAVVAQSWQLILLTVVALYLLKSAASTPWPVFKASQSRPSCDRPVLGAGGEFAFVLYGAAHAVGLDRCAGLLRSLRP